MSAATVTPPPQPAAPPMTAEEFGLKYSGAHVEYVNGHVKEMPMAGSRHGKVCYRVAKLFGDFIDGNNLGHVFINDTFVKVPARNDPERVYGPDVCFIAYDKLPKDAEIPAGVLPVAPNLVVEVRSPSDLWTDAIAKALDYIRSGVPLVIILDPKTKSASVFRPADRHEIVEAENELTLPEVLPGFAARVADFFA